MSDLERITARRSELDALAEELAKRLQEVEAEQEEPGIAERVLRRLAGHDKADTEAAGAATPMKAQVAGACRAADPAPR
jgi:prefoldin subunit 5